MYERPERVSANPEYHVDYPHSQTGPPRIPRIYQSIDVPRVSDGRTDQGGHIRIAADDAVERNDIGRWDVVGEFNEVALTK
jgi:hypothetical protein